MLPTSLVLSFSLNAEYDPSLVKETLLSSPRPGMGPSNLIVGVGAEVEELLDVGEITR